MAVSNPHLTRPESRQIFLIFILDTRLPLRREDIVTSFMKEILKILKIQLEVEIRGQIFGKLT